ncbi:MAG: SDR family oxidoreductase [Spartobacteria bacterium]
MDSGQIVIAGCGFLGEAAAGFFLEAGWRVLGLCATEESAARLAGRPFPVAVVDISKPIRVPAGWESPDVVVHCASSGRGGADAYRAVYRDGLEHLSNAFAPGRLIFTGSTSVYTQVDGGWVTEDSPAEPDRETGRILLEAEKIALEAGGVVARLAGIYGPGRSVLLKKFLDGSALLEAGGNRWINQIHRDDGALALLRLAQHEEAAGIYNVCDDTPTTQLEIYGWIADYLNRPLPPEGPADLNRKRGWTSKRISNARLRSIGWSLRYPGYRDALAELVAAQAE